MSGAGGTLPHPGRPAPGGAVDRFRARLRTSAFWVIQAAVLAVTVIHGLVEFWLVDGGSHDLYDSIRHLPVVLYVIPVIYAGIRFGLEGGLHTGTLITALSIPNLLISHVRGFAWTGELTSVVFVVAVGIAVSVAVEREQRSRAQAEVAGRSLALLTDIAGRLSRFADITGLLEAVLDEVAATLRLEAIAYLPAGGADGVGEPVVRPPDASIPETHMHDTATSEAPPDGIHRIPLMVDGSVVGRLLVRAGHGSSIGPRDRRLLQSVASELAIALENARLHEAERRSRHRYLQAVTSAQEEERKRMARELHDQAQSLVAVARELARQATQAGTGSSLAARLTELRRLVLEQLDGMRRASRDLRPPVLDDLGMVPAVEWLLDRSTASSGFATELRIDGRRRRLASEVELAAFRIVQEAVHNAEKHAHAAAVTVTLRFGDDDLRLTVEDDGVGFDVGEHRAEPTLGLIGMRERAVQLGGTVAVRSRPAAGTSVEVSIPLHPG